MKLFNRQPPDDAERHDYDLAEVQAVAEQARRLAIYDRATQLYAYWYLQLRAGEELSRAQRHGKTVICGSIWAPTPALIDAVCGRLRTGLRDHDLAAYLHNGHFVVLLTDTDSAGSRIVLQRLLAGLEGILAGLASSTSDGSTFDELLEHAKAVAAEPAEDAA